MGVQLENAKLKPLCFDLRWEILYLFVVVICRFLSTSQFYNFYDTKIRITPLSRQYSLSGRTAGKHQLATIVKRSVKNELNPRLYAPCCRAAGERAQVFVPERGGDVAIFQF